MPRRHPGRPRPGAGPCRPFAQLLGTSALRHAAGHAAGTLVRAHAARRRELDCRRYAADCRLCGIAGARSCITLKPHKWGAGASQGGALGRGGSPRALGVCLAMVALLISNGAGENEKCRLLLSKRNDYIFALSSVMIGKPSTT